MAPSDPIVGIDLGTSNSAVAHVDANGHVATLADDAGAKIHPSVVSFHPNGGVIVGAAAKQRKVIDPANTVFSAKRLIGRRYASPEVQTAKTRMPYLIKEGANQMPMIVTRAGEFAVPEVSAIILDHMKSIATARLGTPISRAVVTVPASFNDAQRSATATAGAVAGLTIVRVLNEPTAAALAYGHTRGLKQLIAVYDFGGGTFDVTILKLHDQVYEVLGTAGDSFLGGDDLDEQLVGKMVQKFLVENRVDLRTNEVSMMRLRAVAEQTKIELSRRSRAVVRIDEIAYGPNGAPLNLQIEITRDEFVGEVSKIVDRTFPVCDEALALAGLGVDAIDDVLLVGGTSKIPYVRDQVTKYFGKTPRTDIAPEEAVALGAGLQASALERMLARKPSGRISAAVPIVDFANAETTSPAADTQVRKTNPYGAAPERPSGEYVVKRPGTRDDFGSEPKTDTAVALGRMTQTTPKPLPTVPGMPAVPTASPAAKTMFGVPAAPRGQVSPVPTVDEAETNPTPVLEPSSLTLIPPPARTTAPATVPPPPRQTTAMSAAPPPVPQAKITQPRMAPRPPGPTREQPAVTGPNAPTMFPGGPSPIAATLPTVALAFDDLTGQTTPEPATNPYAPVPQPPPMVEPSSAASTARGFEPAQARTMPAGPTILDVTPRGLGIGTVAGYCEELIKRNSRLPTETIKLFTTSRDRQDMVRIVVCQGESRRLDNNQVIGDLVLQNLPPRPRGETSIEVTFRLDASGILQVRARDALTGNEQSARVDTVGNLSPEEVSVSRDRLQALRR